MNFVTFWEAFALGWYAGAGGVCGARRVESVTSLSHPLVVFLERSCFPYLAFTGLEWDEGHEGYANIWVGRVHMGRFGLQGAASLDRGRCT